MDRVAAFDVVKHLILDPDVGKGAPHHHLVVAPTDTVGVELLGLDAVVHKPLAGGWSGPNGPVGLMWSVVTVSPRVNRPRASSTSETLGFSSGKSVKNGGSRMYVESSSHSYTSPVGASSAAHRSSPSNHFGVLFLEHRWIDEVVNCLVSLVAVRPEVRQIDGVAVLVVPSGSCSKSMSIRPARPYATTSGGLVRKWNSPRSRS